MGKGETIPATGSKEVVAANIGLTGNSVRAAYR
jgi:hypothetical protein